MDYIVVKYGEIALKGDNKAFFEQALIENIRNSLKGLPIDSVKKLYGRLVIKLNDKSNLESIKEKLKQVFGIVYFAPAYLVPLDMEEIKRKSLDLVEDEKTFHVKAKRSKKDFPLTSLEINDQVGSYVIKNKELKVQFEGSDLTIFIEITEKGAFLYKEKFQGLAGLPVGVSGKVISLISGGIDSPVASFKIMKRGCEIIFVHFHNLTTEKAVVKDKVKRLVEILSKYQPKTKLYLIPFGDIQKEIVKTVNSKVRMIVYRRMMLRIAEEILKKEKALAFVTGDSIAQVASQTLENIYVVRAVSNYPVLSPLIGMDKEEIIKIAKDIGTYETSILPYSDCCSMFIAEHPETRARLENIEREEKFNADNLIKEAVEKSEIVEFGLVRSSIKKSTQQIKDEIREELYD